jgi:hypothetical protein
MLPGITDLRGNALRSGRTIIFSTGPTIPLYSVLGRVFDWMNERIAPKALIEMIRRPDSLPYVGVADSSGQFQVGPLEQGSYTVRAILDNNNNRLLDPTEPWDSIAVTVANASPFVELLVAPRDTIPPRLLTVTAPDTVTLAASFDRPLDPGAPLTPASFIVTAADSTRLRIKSVRTRAQDDSARRAAQDSAAKAQRDSIARSDTTRSDTTRRDTTRRDTTRRDTTRRDTTRRDTTRRDSVRARIDTAPVARLNPNIAPKPSRPAPPKEVAIHLDPLTPLHPGSTYRVTALNMRGLLGRARSSERLFTVPRPRVDTTKALTPAPPPQPPPSPVRRPPPPPP